MGATDRKMGLEGSKFRTLTFRKRNIVERKVLRLLRGDVSRTVGEGPASHQDIAGPFGDLRDHAERAGMRIHPIEAACLAPDELLILRWLAEAQRGSGLQTFRSGDDGLPDALRRCAELLKSLDVLLPSQTLKIGARLNGGQIARKRAGGCPLEHAEDCQVMR